MRPREPFNGFKSAQGNLIYHIALLVGSLVVIEVNPTANNEKEEMCKLLINWIRAMHLYVIFSTYISSLLDTVENDLFGKYFNTIELIVYQGTVFYELFFLLHNPLIKETEGFEKIAKEWVIIEMIIYFFQIFNTAIFLLYIVIRGELGKTDNKIKDRNRRAAFDPIEYYWIDIQWLSFQLVMLFLHFTVLYIRVTYDDKAFRSFDPTVSILIMLVLERALQLFFFNPFRGQNRILTAIKWWKVAILLIIQMIAWIL